MILLAHPFGNANVRALLETFERRQRLARFITTFGYSEEAPFLSLLSPGAHRRAYALPGARIVAYPWREMARLAASAIGWKGPLEHEHGWASIDRIWQELDLRAARYFEQNREREQIDVVYAYEDCALQLFQAAGKHGAHCAYDLPIAYFETAQRLLREEAARYPEWEPTLGGTRDSAEKLARKKEELELADLVVCPSRFVLDSLPENVRAAKPCIVAPFGSPHTSYKTYGSYAGPLRILFAGALTQRKGLADLFAAMQFVDPAKVELVVMGSLLQPLAWYRARCPAFRYEPPRPHSEVLALMRSCDVFVLPSIVEGRALVQQEAMASGVPVIATPNAGCDDLITEGETGFLVPIRSPEALAEKINWCAAHRERISGMGIAARERAAKLTWPAYGEAVLAALDRLTGS